MRRLAILLVWLAAGLATATATDRATDNGSETLPLNIFSGEHQNGHIQGITLDAERGHFYFSFTTKLVKTDLAGNIIGSVSGLLGHLGCIDFNAAERRIYGSLEYKDDVIGRGVLSDAKSNRRFDSAAFYIAIFDVDKIDRCDMSAERDGVMRTIYLPTVVEDFGAKVSLNGKTVEHRFGCSGIDGVTFGPRFGKRDGKHYLTVAYGIYFDKERSDNDCQVLLQYDTEGWAESAQPLSHDNLHRTSPKQAPQRYFVRTGNTNWGVQNLEYDAHTNLWFLAVYRGSKEQFTPFDYFIVDGSAKPCKCRLEGYDYLTSRQSLLPLAELGEQGKESICGFRFEYGATGLHSNGDGTFYISHPHRNPKNRKIQSCNARLYRLAAKGEKLFEKIEKR